MKKFLIPALVAVLVSIQFPAHAQKPSQADYLDRYTLLVNKLGVEGVGVETLLQRWGKDYPDDMDMLLGKFTYYLSKSQSNSMEKIDASKYLGEAPTLTLKDSLGNDVNYFQVTNYDDELFGQATQAIDKAIGLAQDRLDLRLYKIAALIGYEKGSPDMALSGLKELIDYDGHSHPTWIYPGLEPGPDLFPSLVQEYCYTFFRQATPASYEAFKEVSEKMAGYYPKNTVFLTNIGSYYLVYKHDSKNALKMYNKVLKKDPGDYTAIKNCVLLARNDKNKKLEKKYLAMLAKVTPDETEKLQAEARLKSL
jgi:tetratricopeptide (TPR) repeat protein